MTSNSGWTDVEQQYIAERNNRYVDAEFTPVATEKMIDLYGTVDTSHVFLQIVDHKNYVLYEVVKYVEYANNRVFKQDDPVNHPYGYYVGEESRNFFVLQKLNLLGSTRVEESVEMGILTESDLEQLYDVATLKQSVFNVSSMFWSLDQGTEYRPTEGEDITVTIPIIELRNLHFL